MNDRSTSVFETKDAAINYSLYIIINDINRLLNYCSVDYTNNYDWIINHINNFIIFYNENEFEKAIKYFEDAKVISFQFHEIEINYDLMPLSEIDQTTLDKINKIRTFQ